jgi:hypothetical protein
MSGGRVLQPWRGFSGVHVQDQDND